MAFARVVIALTGAVPAVTKQLYTWPGSGKPLLATG